MVVLPAPFQLLLIASILRRLGDIRIYMQKNYGLALEDWAIKEVILELSELN